MHLLLFLHPDDHPQDAAHIDEIICTELPDPALDLTEELIEIIKSIMVYRPCSVIAPNMPYMVHNGNSGLVICSKGYP